MGGLLDEYDEDPHGYLGRLQGLLGTPPMHSGLLEIEDPAAGLLSMGPMMARKNITSLPSSDSLNLPPAPSAAAMSGARIENVPLSKARGTQPKMQWERFNKGDHGEPVVKGYEDHPVAVRREDGEYLIFDGHHRTVKAMQDGRETMPMYVIDAKSYAPESAGRKSVAPAYDANELEMLLRELSGK